MCRTSICKLKCVLKRKNCAQQILPVRVIYSPAEKVAARQVLDKIQDKLKQPNGRITRITIMPLIVNEE